MAGWLNLFRLLLCYLVKTLNNISFNVIMSVFKVLAELIRGGPALDRMASGGNNAVTMSHFHILF